jgi:excisionase family DNA binding protein
LTVKPQSVPMNSRNNENVPLLTIAEAATFLNVSKATIRRWTNEGRLQCLRIGARDERRFHKRELVAFLGEDSSQHSAGPDPMAETVASVSARAAHRCLVIKDRDEEWEVLAPAILSGLGEGAQVLMIEVADRKDRLEKLFKSKGLSKRKLLASHALRSVSVEDSYFLSGEFRWDRAIAFFESAILDAKARGFEKVMIIGADSGALDSGMQGYADEVKEYELGFDEMLARHPNASVLCPYIASEISAQLMAQGFLTHPHMQINGTSVPGLLGQVAI